MSKSGGMGQLTKGIVVGIVLILAIVGTMSIFDKAKNRDTPLASGNKTTVQNPTDIPSPSINVNIPGQQAEKTDNLNSQKNLEKDSEATDTKKNKEPLSTENKKPDVVAKKNSNFTPVLENERILKEKPVEKPKFGLLQVSAINPNTQKRVLANFVVLNKSGKRVAEAKGVKGTSFRLPIGKYKVITTLKKSGGTRVTRPVQSTKTIRVSANKKISRTFKLEPAPTLGVLQVSAQNSNNGKSIKANYVIQKENGAIIATRTNVTHTLFKLNAGSYKVIVKNGSTSDSRTIVVEPGESTKQIFKLQETIKQGQLLVRVFDTRSSKPIRADIIITTSNGTVVHQLRKVTQTDISLSTGKYKIRVTGPNGQSTKNITISAGQKANEVFRFDVPTSKPMKEVQITENVKITAPRNTPPPITQPSIQETRQEPAPKSKGSLKLYARNDGNNVPLKSNFYVQLSNGKNIAKKVYSNSAQFSLDPGVYRITVRSKNRKNIVKMIRVLSGQSSTEVFSLISALPKPRKIAQIPNKTPVLAPPKPVKIVKPKPVTTNTIPNGFLSVAMQPPKNTHFIVATRSGKKIVELTSVPSANFKLDTGQYVVTAIQNKRRKTKKIRVRTGQTTRITFKAAQFQKPRNNQRNTAIPMGVLRSRIVNRNGQALRGNITVTNSRGQVVARANGVSVGIFDLPPKSYTVILNYRGLRGSERVNIRPKETTMQTFTVAPNRSQSGNN